MKESIKVMTPFPIGGSVSLGQEIYFIGYPSFNNIQFKTTGSIGILPLVKRGIISGWEKINSYNLYFLDGHNNPGFSGGPVVTYDFETGNPVIFGVISGYFFENKQVKNNLGLDDSTYIQENSGIIKCYPTAVIDQVIK